MSNNNDWQFSGGDWKWIFIAAVIAALTYASCNSYEPGSGDQYKRDSGEDDDARRKRRNSDPKNGVMHFNPLASNKSAPANENVQYGWQNVDGKDRFVVPAVPDLS